MNPEILDIWSLDCHLTLWALLSMIRLRLILLLNHYVESVQEHAPDIDIGEIERILLDAEGLLQRFDEELDAEQVGTWLQYPTDRRELTSQASLAHLIVPGFAVSSAMYGWNRANSASMICRWETLRKVRRDFDYTVRARRVMSRFVHGMKRMK